jgi:RNA polymerase sigma-70 factor, ECF subfamily
MEHQLTIPDSQLVAEARSGSEKAFEELVRRHSSKVYGVSLRILKNREDAEDNAQNTFIKALNNLGKFAGQSQFSTWLFRITVNEALMKVRTQQLERRATQTESRSRDSNRSELPEIQDARQDFERQYLYRDLTSKALVGLNPELKKTFLLHKGEGWTNRELAGLMGITVETVKSRVFRARSRARRRLELLARGEWIAYQG